MDCRKWLELAAWLPLDLSSGLEFFFPVVAVL